MNEQRLNDFLGDNEDKNLGTGWWANVLSTFFGALAFGGVLCLYFPQQLTTPDLGAFLRQTIMPFFKPNEKRLESQG